MQKLQICYVTWPRPDANDLFDYQAGILSPAKKIIIEESGTIYRDQQSFSLKFFPHSSKIKSQQKFQMNPILKVNKKEGHFFIDSVTVSKESLCKIIKSQQNQKHKLRLYDKLRIGKVQVEVMQIGFKVEKFKTRYEQLKNQTQKSGMSKILEITSSFYQQSDQSHSLIDDNPACRYCHSKTVSNQNPFIVSCHCKGHTRFIHENCLLEWITKRGTLSEVKGKGIFYIQSKLLKCQLCKDFFQVCELFKKIYNYQKNVMNIQMDPISDQIMILHFKYQTEFFFFIDVSISQTISIGRSLENQVVLNELSVSRRHSFLTFNYEEKQVTIRDNQSKFGTLIQVLKTQIQGQQTYQLGRSQITFQKYRKKSFFDKLGFCVFEQKLRKQKKKKQND